MESKQFLKYVAFVAVAGLVHGANAETKKPNVILLFSDQHRADVLGCAGHADAVTPNLDRLAANGVMFTRAYCQDAISAPSRASLFSGLYPATTGCIDNTTLETDVMKNAYSLQSAFQDNGYATYAFGKRHLNGTIDKGWTVHKSHLANESPEDNYLKWIESEGYAEEFGEDWATEFGVFPKGNSLAGKKYPTAPMGTRPTKLDANHTMEAYSALNTIEVIKKHKDSDQPFFCFTSFYRPHQPYNALPQYLKNYDISRWGKGRNNGDAIAMPPTLRQPAEDLPVWLANIRKSFNGIWCLGKAAQDEQLYRDYVGTYYALVEEIDYWVGEIFKALEENGMADNTIIIYTSDHGDFVGNHGMIEKAALGHNIYEETVRIPMIFYWKDKFAKNYNCSELVELIDLYPTLVDLVGLDMPELKNPVQGLSLAKTLKSKKPVKRDFIVTENWSQATIITKDHKLGIWLDPNPVAPERDFRDSENMLFEYASDPYETKNLINDSKYIPVIEKLEGYYDSFKKEVSREGSEEVKAYKAQK